MDNFNRYYQLARFIARQVPKRAPWLDRQSVEQAALLALWLHKDEAPCDNFYRKILRNAVVDELRQQARQWQRQRAGCRPEGSYQPDTSLEDDEFIDNWLKTALHRLDDKFGKLLMMLHNEEDIPAKTGAKPNTVAVWIYRLRNKLTKDGLKPDNL